MTSPTNEIASDSKEDGSEQGSEVDPIAQNIPIADGSGTVAQAVKNGHPTQAGGVTAVGYDQLVQIRDWMLTVVQNSLTRIGRRRYERREYEFINRGNPSRVRIGDDKVGFVYQPNKTVTEVNVGNKTLHLNPADEQRLHDSVLLSNYPVALAPLADAVNRWWGEDSPSPKRDFEAAFSSFAPAVKAVGEEVNIEDAVGAIVTSDDEVTELVCNLNTTIPNLNNNHPVSELSNTEIDCVPFLGTRRAIIKPRYGDSRDAVVLQHNSYTGSLPREESFVVEPRTASIGVRVHPVDGTHLDAKTVPTEDQIRSVMGYRETPAPNELVPISGSWARLHDMLRARRVEAEDVVPLDNSPVTLYAVGVVEEYVNSRVDGGSLSGGIQITLTADDDSRVEPEIVTRGAARPGASAEQLNELAEQYTNSTGQGMKKVIDMIEQRLEEIIESRIRTKIGDDSEMPDTSPNDAGQTTTERVGSHRVTIEGVTTATTSESGSLCVEVGEGASVSVNGDGREKITYDLHPGKYRFDTLRVGIQTDQQPPIW